MLKFILSVLFHKLIPFGFQYISCWSLSPLSGFTVCFNFLFQYISCWSLSRSIWDRKPCWIISIHLMLKFIPVATRLIVTFPDFNTSHVEVYPITDTGVAVTTIFQYISCWSLSTYISKSLASSYAFQYISCWSLSIASKLIWYNAVHFNTSHVEVYLLMRTS